MCRIILFIFLLAGNSLVAQVDQSSASHKIDSTYLIYQQQLSSLLITRGLPRFEIRMVLDQYKRNQITSNENFAAFLADSFEGYVDFSELLEIKVGIVLYFFHNDTLRRVFFEPGIVKENKAIPIKRDELIDLAQGIHSSLKVNELGYERAPHKRGATVEDVPRSKRSYKQIIKRATDILLPEFFDESYKHLIIVPALNIGVFPFHLLRPYSDDKLLIERCSFSISPSLLEVVSLRERLRMRLKSRGGNLPFPAKASNTLDGNCLFVSNPNYPDTAEYYFPDLPGAVREVDSAIRYAGVYQRFGADNATKDQIVKAMNRADLAYFATHGIASEENPMEKSYLVLAGEEPYLTAKEIIELRLNRNFKFPELVILSACQTGRGKSMESGIAGLARSFLIGGSDQVIMSLWNVDDNATAFLMSRFMGYLHEPHYFYPAEQLRLAIIDTMERYPNPIYWASFSVFGVTW